MLLIGLLVERHAHELARRQVFGFLLFALEEELPDLGQELRCTGVGVIVRLAGPDGVLVELDALVSYSAEDHAAQEAVAHGQSFHPQFGGMLVPEG